MMQWLRRWAALIAFVFALASLPATGLTTCSLAVSRAGDG